MKRILLMWVSIACVAACTGSAAGKEMTFDLRPVTFQNGRIFYQIFAEGEIVAGTASRLDKIISSMTVGRLQTGVVYLNSPGGSVAEAIRMARLVRRARLATGVLKQRNLEDGLFLTGPGRCMSACILAFMGGIVRGVGERSEIGVHQFAYAGAKTNIDSSTAISTSQIISGDIVTLIAESGVDPLFFQLISQIPPERIYIVPHDLLEMYKVIGDPLAEEAITFDLIKGTTWLKLETKNTAGESSLEIRCHDRILLAIVNVADDDAPGLNTPGIVIDDEKFELSPEFVRQKPIRFKSAFITTSIAIPRDIAKKFLGATKVGGFLKSTAGGYVYYAQFTVNTISGRDKIESMIGGCLSG